MHVRCSYCRHSFNLSRDYLAQALVEAEKEKQKYHGVECMKCRKIIKVPLSQMRRYAPRPETIEEEEITD
jgi:hypothetical protein